VIDLVLFAAIVLMGAWAVCAPVTLEEDEDDINEQ